MWPGKALRAFSLVEVTIALGVVSISLVTLMGLMPVGLDQLRESQNSVVRTRIVQQIAGEAQMVPFSNLVTYIQKSPQFFDADGMRRDIPKADNDTAYSASLSEREPASDSPLYPGAGLSSNLSNNLVALKICITRLNGPARAGSDYVVHISNQGE